MANQQGQLEPGALNRGAPESAYVPESDSESTDKIRRDIAYTRSEMDQTLDALGERLRPIHLLEDLVNVFRRHSSRKSTSKKRSTSMPAASASESRAASQDVPHQAEDQDRRGAVSSLMGMVRDHPLSAALIGSGVAWMIYEEVKGDPGEKPVSRSALGYGRRVKPKQEPTMYSGSYVDARTGKPYDVNAYRKEGEAMMRQTTNTTNDPTCAAGSQEGPGVAKRAKELAHQAGEKLSGALDSTRESISGAAGTAGNWVQSAKGSAREGLHHVRQWGDQANEQIQHGYESARDNVRKAADEYPLSLGIAAVAAGLLSGLLLPATRREKRLMSDSSQRVRQQVSSAGRKAMDRGKEIATASVNAAAGEAERQGLNPSSLMDKVERVVGDLGRCASETAQREGLKPDNLGDKVKRVAEQVRDTAKDETKRHTSELKQEFKQST